MMNSIVYAHFDMKADGPCVLNNNMISLGISFTDASGNEVDNLLLDMDQINGHKPNNTFLTNFWFKDDINTNEYKRIIKNSIPINIAIEQLAQKIAEHYKGNKKIIWVYGSAACNWSWLKNYYENFKPHNIEIKTDQCTTIGKTPEIGDNALCLSSMFWMYCNTRGLPKKQCDQKWNQLTGDINLVNNTLDNARVRAKVFHRLIEDVGIIL